jgi:hypothetical protein
MIIGTSYLTQIRGGEDTGQLAGDLESDQTRTERTVGGWTALQFSQSVATIQAGFHREHNPDDTHSVIHATGAIYERSRTTPMGEWLAVPFTPANFTASGTMTWTVAAADCLNFTYMLIGKTLWINIYINTSTIGGVAAQDLRIAIPGGFVPSTNYFVGVVRCTNNTNFAGNLLALADTPYLVVRTADDSNWNVVAATVRLTGQVALAIR